MKKISCLYLTLFCVAVSLFLFPHSAMAQPKIEFTETEYDLGETYQNKKISHVFKLQNVGTEMLIIEKVKAG